MNLLSKFLNVQFFSLIHKSDEGILSTVNSRNLLDDSLIEENTLDLSNLNLSPSQ